MDEAAHLKKSFQSFKKNLLEKISPQKPKDHKDSWEILKKTIFKFEKRDTELNSDLPNLDMESYDAIIDHYKSYGALLKSLQIESAMNPENQNSPIFDKSLSSNASAADINLIPMLEECMGEIELLDELIGLYERNALEFIGASKLHLKTGDFRLLELAAHKIKAGLAMMGTMDLHSIILQVEHACKKDKDIKHLNFLCKCFTDEFPIVQKALNDALVKLKQK